MEIPDNTGAPVCATCGPVSWMWSERRETWVAFIPVPDDRTLYRLHQCQHAQDLPTWRQVRQRDEPPAEYLAAKQAIERRAS